MAYLLVALGLFGMELLYFRIADRFNIIDRPNERSSHTRVTLRGGGVIFYLAAAVFFVLSGFQYPWFFLGLTLMTVVSFLDDVVTLSNRIRLVVHFASVMLMAQELDVFAMPWYYLLILFVVVVGVINAYNFMDGINGITAAYSLSVGGLLLLVNQDWSLFGFGSGAASSGSMAMGFVHPDLLIYSLLGVLVFAFFNFRTRAKCFAGDVGSVAIAYILLFCLGALIFQTGNLLYFLFLAVYGIDSVWTIIRRLSLGENIFQAHRSHLYQYLGNEAGVNKLLVSFLYGFLQFVIGLLVIVYAERSVSEQLIFAAVLLLSMSAIYLVVKQFVIRNYVTSPRHT